MSSTHVPGSGIDNRSEGTANPDRRGDVPAIIHQELVHRNAAAVCLLDVWEAEGEQRETMRVLRQALARSWRRRVGWLFF